MQVEDASLLALTHWYSQWHASDGRFAAGGLCHPSEAEELSPLLDEPESNRWLAFQLLELCQPTSAVREKCLAIIQDMAVEPGPAGLGAKWWLRDFKG